MQWPEAAYVNTIHMDRNIIISSEYAYAQYAVSRPITSFKSVNRQIKIQQ